MVLARRERHVVHGFLVSLFGDDNDVFHSNVGLLPRVRCICPKVTPFVHDGLLENKGVTRDVRTLPFRSAPRCFLATLGELLFRVLFPQFLPVG